LFDKLSQPAAPQLPTNQQSRIEQLLAAKKGKVAAAPAPVSNVGEQVAGDQAKTALQQQGLQTALQGAAANVQRQGLEQDIAQQGAAQQQAFDLQRQGMTSEANRNLGTLSGQEQLQTVELDAAKQRKLRSINSQAESQLRALAAQGRMDADDIFADFKRSNQELEFRQDAAQLEQLGTLLALQDRKYIDELNRIGEKRKLYDRSNWEKEKARVIYGETLDSLMRDLNFQRGEDVSNRDYQRQLAQIDIDTAISMAEAAMRDEATRAMWEAGISAASTAAGTDWSKFAAEYKAPDSSAFAEKSKAESTPSFDVTGGDRFTPNYFEPAR
jgi:hypothetical protein